MTRNSLFGAAALALIAGPALADGWLEGLAKQTAGQVVQQGAADAVKGALAGRKKPRPVDGERASEAPAQAPATQSVASNPSLSNEDPFAEPGEAPAQPVAADGPSPWPTNAAKAGRPSEFMFDPSVKAAKDAFVEWSRYSCTGCEGGRGYDAWARQGLNLGGYNAFEKRIGGLSVGQSVTWNGVEADGSITVVGDSRVGAFACKQVKWSLKKRKTGAETSRDGLFCLGKANQYAGSDSWIEVI